VELVAAGNAELVGQIRIGVAVDGHVGEVVTAIRLGAPRLDFVRAVGFDENMNHVRCGCGFLGVVARVLETERTFGLEEKMQRDVFALRFRELEGLAVRRRFHRKVSGRGGRTGWRSDESYQADQEKDSEGERAGERRDGFH